MPYSLKNDKRHVEVLKVIYVGSSHMTGFREVSEGLLAPYYFNMSRNIDEKIKAKKSHVLIAILSLALIASVFLMYSEKVDVEPHLNSVNKIENVLRVR